jgi:hypothetical protein
MHTCQDQHTTWLLASIQYAFWGRKNIGRREEEKINRNVWFPIKLSKPSELEIPPTRMLKLRVV